MGNKREKNRVCWACETDLTDHQNKCLECESWQNWRRFIAISDSSLALLVALLSVLTVVVPVLAPYFKSHQEQLFLSGFVKPVKSKPLGDRVLWSWRINLRLRNPMTESAFVESTLRCPMGSSIPLSIHSGSDTFIEPGSFIDMKFEHESGHLYRTGPHKCEVRFRSFGGDEVHKIEFLLPLNPHLEVAPLLTMDQKGLGGFPVTNNDTPTSD